MYLYIYIMASKNTWALRQVIFLLPKEPFPLLSQRLPVKKSTIKPLKTALGR